MRVAPASKAAKRVEVPPTNRPKTKERRWAQRRVSPSAIHRVTAESAAAVREARVLELELVVLAPPVVAVRGLRSPPSQTSQLTTLDAFCTYLNLPRLCAGFFCLARVSNNHSFLTYSLVISIKRLSAFP